MDVKTANGKDQDLKMSRYNRQFMTEKGGHPNNKGPPELKTDAGDAAKRAVIASREGENMEQWMVRILRDAVEGRKADLSGKRP